MGDKPYKNIVKTVKIPKTDIVEFVSLAEQIDNGIIQVCQGQYVVSGKSLINLMMLDFNNNQKLIMQGNISDDYISKFMKWEVVND